MAEKSLYNSNSFRPVALSIAGYDPSGGAGVLADIKTFESLGVYGISIITGNTFQNDITFKGVSWLKKKEKKKNIVLLAQRFSVKAIKLGMHKNLDDIKNSIKQCKKYFPDAKIIWDPILAASAGFDLDIVIKDHILNKIFSSISLVTPNHSEACKLAEIKYAEEAAKELSIHCPVLLKGGHSKSKTASNDYLFIRGNKKMEYKSPRIKNGAKHGSGCVLSAAIVASFAKGDNLENAINNGKKYISNFLKSNNTLLGYHKN